MQEAVPCYCRCQKRHWRWCLVMPNACAPNRYVIRMRSKYSTRFPLFSFFFLLHVIWHVYVCVCVCVEISRIPLTANPWTSPSNGLCVCVALCKYARFECVYLAQIMRYTYTMMYQNIWYLYITEIKNPWTCQMVYVQKLLSTFFSFFFTLSKKFVSFSLLF